MTSTEDGRFFVGFSIVSLSSTRLLLYTGRVKSNGVVGDSVVVTSSDISIMVDSLAIIVGSVGVKIGSVENVALDSDSSVVAIDSVDGVVVGSANIKIGSVDLTIDSVVETVDLPFITVDSLEVGISSVEVTVGSVKAVVVTWVISGVDWTVVDSAMGTVVPAVVVVRTDDCSVWVVAVVLSSSKGRSVVALRIVVDSVLGVTVVGDSGFPNSNMLGQSKFGNEGNQDLKSHSSVSHSEQYFSPAIFRMIYQLPKWTPQSCFGSKITLAIANEKKRLQ